MAETWRVLFRAWRGAVQPSGWQPGFSKESQDAHPMSSTCILAASSTASCPWLDSMAHPLRGNPSFDAARHFGLEHLWQLPETPGVLSCEAWKLGITAIGTEYLGAAQLSAAGVRAYTEGVLSCLAEWGIAQRTFSMEPRGHAFQGDWQLAAATGGCQAQCALGDSLKRGDLLAAILDVRGRLLRVSQALPPGSCSGSASKACIRENDWGMLTGILTANE